ncbi:MAG: thiol reductase thioredoxin [Planctomycetes bacterium]|nr:thiol reductase thioredoxin [Planctomycetota bacterium]NOG55887.1 thiol reductase thioredoxin [Planctomycetota bacterium]
MLSTQVFQQKFDAGLTYEQYLETGNADQKAAWQQIHESVALTDDQQKLVGSFVREMRVICISGIWCGDCVQQGPLLQRIAEGNADTISLVWLDRDTHQDLAEELKINAGMRVPVVIFAAEDNEVVSIYGDRTLTRYRAIAQRQLGAHCTIPGAPVPKDELAGTLQDWLNEFERVQLLLRTSARLRDKHGD